MEKKLGFLLMGYIWLVLLACVAGAANYPLEIIQPQEGLDVRNRFYKAYPGLEYNVRVAVIGGLFPNTYTLETHPPGMTIDAHTGVISWPNPTEEGSPHTVTVKVVDAEGSVDVHTWHITVTTQGFKFLDAVNGKTVAQGGKGTIDNPWKTLGDMYENDKNASSYSGDFLYFRNGTYAIDVPLEDGNRMALISYRKPLVWLAYPGESPAIDLSAGQIAVYSGGDNLYVDGFEIINISNSTGEGWRVDSASSNITFRRNNFHTLVDQGVTNQACVFIANSGTGQYWSFTENLFHDVVGGNGIEAYKAEKVLVENNQFYNFFPGQRPGHALGPKMSYRYWFIRDNLFYACEAWSIWADGYTNSGPTEHLDVSFNLVRTAGTYAFQANYDGGDMGQIYVYRNTFIGPVSVRFASSGRGPFIFYNNVIINNDVGIKCESCTDLSVLIDKNNLKAKDSDGVVDINGNLTDAYSKYLGVYGYQIITNGEIIKPLSPREFRRSN